MKYLDSILPAVPRLFVATGKSKEKSLLNDSTEHISTTVQAELFVAEEGLSIQDIDKLCIEIIQLAIHPERGIPISLRASFKPPSLVTLGIYFIPPLALTSFGYLCWTRYLGSEVKKKIVNSLPRLVMMPLNFISSIQVLVLKSIGKLLLGGSGSSSSRSNASS